MNFETVRYVRKALYVDALRVTEGNRTDVALWCHGAIVGDPTNGHIQVPTKNTRDPRQGQARVGDWVLQMGASFKVYTNRAFTRTFRVAPEPVKLEPVSLADAEEAAKVLGLADYFNPEEFETFWGSLNSTAQGMLMERVRAERNRDANPSVDIVEGVNQFNGGFLQRNPRIRP